MKVPSRTRALLFLIEYPVTSDYSCQLNLKFEGGVPGLINLTGTPIGISLSFRSSFPFRGQSLIICCGILNFSYPLKFCLHSSQIIVFFLLNNVLYINQVRVRFTSASRVRRVLWNSLSLRGRRPTGSSTPPTTATSRRSASPMLRRVFTSHSDSLLLDNSILPSSSSSISSLLR